MTSDPYPDLLAVEDLTPAPGGDRDDAPGERPALSEADTRLLAALFQPQPAVVAAVEDEPRTVRAAQGDRVAPVAAPGTRSRLTPVFQEPTG